MKEINNMSKEELIEQINSLKKDNEQLSQFKIAIEQSPAAIVITDKEANIEYVNPYFSEITGYSLEEAKGKNPRILKTDGTSKKTYENLWDTLSKGNIWKGQFVNRKKDKSLYYEYATIAPVFIKDEIVKYVAIKKDITKQIESEIRFRELFENMQSACAVYTIDDEGKKFIFKDINSAVEEIEDIQKENVIGRDVTEVFPGIIDLGLINIFQSVLKSGKPEHFPVSFYKDNRIEGWRENYIYKISNTEIVAIYQDLTKQKKIEEALRESEEKFRLLVQDLSDAIVTVDPNENIVFINPAGVKLFGVSEEIALSKCIFDFLNKSDVELLYERGKNRKDNVFDNYIIAINRPDNTQRIVEVNANAIFDSNDKFIGSTAVLHDITEIKQTEIELIKAKMQAEESDRLKSAFLTNISHEIRTPLNGILGFTQLLRSQDLPDESKESFIDIIDKNGQHLLEMLNDIIDLSKIESGQLKLHKSSISIATLMFEMSEFLKSLLFTQNKNEIEIIFHNNMYKGAELIISDNDRLRQILRNIIYNAVKFTTTGYIEIMYFLDDEAKNIIISVKDTGIGISEEDLPIIFQRFRQIDDKITRQYEGTGLGLSVSQACSNLLSGKIWCESVLGKGATFFAKIPYQTIDK